MGSSNHGAGEMCLEAAAAGGGAGRRAGGKKAAVAAEQKGAARQPQRGLGVAQLEKIRMQNQIMAAYRSGMPQQAAMAGAASSFQPYLAECFEAMDRRIAADVQYSQYYAENLQPYTASRPAATTPTPTRQQQQQQQPPPPMSFVHGAVKAGYSPPPPPSQYHWMSSTLHESSATGRSSAGSSTEELDLELRL